MKAEKTQNQKAKEKKKSKFDCIIEKDFVNAVVKSKFGHICDKCSNKFYCKKGKIAIVLSCDTYKENKEYKEKVKRKFNKKR